MDYSRIIYVMAVLTGVIIGLAIAALLPDDADARVAGANSTAYCLTGRMADGTYTRPRSAASNRHPLGTRITLTSRQAGPGGLRRYVIRDRIGYGSDLDLWTGSCATARAYGRRIVTYRLGWRTPR